MIVRATDEKDTLDKKDTLNIVICICIFFKILKKKCPRCVFAL